MKKIIVSGSGFPGTTKTLEYLQDGSHEALSGIASWLGNYVILSGVRPVGSSNNYTAGYVTYGGEIIPFRAGTFHNKVSIIKNIQNANYDMGNSSPSLPAYSEKYCRFGEIQGALGTVNFSQFKRINLQDMQNKLAGIEQNAQKNVIPDWNETNANSQDYVKNKPFQSIKITTGVVAMNNITYGNHPNDMTKNYAYILPPIGYHINQLQGFIPSINTIYYDKQAGSSSLITFWCKYYKVAPTAGSGYIHVWCNSSTGEYTTYVNYMAIWMNIASNLNTDGQGQQ